MLKHTPTQNDLIRMYYELSQRGAPLVGDKVSWDFNPKNDEELVALAIGMSRYDARLFGILIGWLNSHWKNLNPYTFRKVLLTLPTPQIIGVVASFLQKLSRDPERIYFFTYLTQGLKPVSHQLFYLGTYPLGGHLSEKASSSSLAEFSSWGFLCSDRPTIDPFHKTTLGKFQKHTRLYRLEELIRKRKKIKISDYLDVIDHCISRQQALVDLQSAPFVRQKGHGRSAFWILKS